MKIKAILLGAALMLSAAAMGQTATKVSLTKANDYGLVYSLPNTVLDITIETEFTEKTPGDFYNYAKRNLNIDNAITTPSRTCRVKSLAIVPRGEIGTDNQWMVQFKAGAPVFVMLSDNNMLEAINTEEMPARNDVELPVAHKAEPTPLETPAARQAVTQEMTMSSSTFKRAQLAAERVFELRENRNELISGQADNMPPDGKALQLALDNLSAQEAALTAMFAGTVKTWTEVATLTYTPGTEDVANEILARISPTDGLVDVDDLSGEPIYLSMQVVTRGQAPLDERGAPRVFPKNGIAYQIPGTAQFNISCDGELLGSQQVNLAQLGVTFGLDPKIFSDKRAPGYATFNPVTGGVITVGVKE